MVAYSAADIAHHLNHARAQGIRLRPGTRPLIYHATSAQTGRVAYAVTVAPDLVSAECTCPAGQSAHFCKHGAAAISAARLARAHQAARDLRRHQIWSRQLATVAA